MDPHLWPIGNHNLVPTNSASWIGDGGADHAIPPHSVNSNLDLSSVRVDWELPIHLGVVAVYKRL